MTLHKKIIATCLLFAALLGSAGASFAQLSLPGNTCDPTQQSCAGNTTPPGSIPSATLPGGGNSCTGSTTGKPCEKSVGNPINVITGNKYQQEVDLPALPGVLGLEIVRHYNSNFGGHTIPAGIVGRGWKLSYETDLYAIGRTVQIVQADGTRTIFSRDLLDPSQCSTANPADGKVVITKTGRGDEYVWTWMNGRKLSFNNLGKLVQIQAPTGEFVTMQHDPKGMLLKVTDPQGRELRLSYLDPKIASKGDRFRGVQTIDSPVGRFQYEYGSELPKGATLDKVQLLANLAKVTIPTHYNSNQKVHAWTERGITSSSISRIYHYEDALRPTLLTGITVTGSGSDGKLMNQRISTFGYNIDGKAILSTHANDVDKVTLDFSEGGKTVLTNSLGQKTTYRHAIIGGEYRLLDVRGSGCALCGEPNVKYGYDKFGRLTETTKLNQQGQALQTTRTELDYYGRVIKVSRVAYQNGKPGQARSLMRYEYRGENMQPTLIARPSIVPGQESVTRVSYNGKGQPLSVSESGWSPSINGKSQATSIARTTTYSYTDMNGRSLLTQIDGPLANGKSNSPADSDITRVNWDSKGNAVVAMITPGDFKSTVQYDEVGRIVNVANTEGNKTIFAYNTRNQLIATSSDGITQSTLYDALDHAVEIGYGDGKTYKPLAHFGFDGAGRNIWTASHLGILDGYRFDTEGNLLEATTQSTRFKQTQNYSYDELGRLIAVTDATGGTRRIGWNAQSLPDVMIDALGRAKRYRYDAMGNLVQVIEAANTVQAQIQNTSVRFEHDALGRIDSIIAPNGATTRYVKDDFGRTLAIDSADSGMVTRTYDEAGRFVASTDANGNWATYEYDVIGRIVKQVVIDARATDPAKRQMVTVWKYEGRRLVAVEDSNQTERYGYGDRGRLDSKTIIVKLANGTRSTSITRYRYDALAQVAAVSMPDGSTVNYKRNGQNQITAIERSPIHTPWLKWLLPVQPIVKDLERDIVGVKRYTYGNGIEASYQRSREGALARIVYRHPDARTGGNQQSAMLDAIFGVTPAYAAETGVPNAQAGRVAATTSALPGALGLTQEPKALLDHRYLWDVQGNLLRTQSKDKTSDYAYDAQDRLIAAGITPSASTSTSVSKPAAGYARYFYDGAGNRVLAQEGIADQADTRTNTVKTAYGTSSNRWQGITDGTSQARYDATGQPARIGNREYVWDALGKLIEVRQENRTLASYRYNHRGERIGKATGSSQTYYLYEGRKLTAELNDKGRVTRQYVYLADQPIAVIDTPKGTALSSEERSYLTQIAANIATAFNAWFSSNDAIAYLHNNHLGATELVTDVKGNPVWRAAYSPFGKIVQASIQNQSGSTQEKTGFRLNLRLSGQYADEETGLYYNDHRYYDPQRGQYLTPDPLGLRGGMNSYAYVNGNPLRYIDPSGLILFAFDGTNNSNPPPGVDDFSNVYKFYQAYDDGKKWYMNGVGRDDPDSGIQANWFDDKDANTARARVDYMLEQLDGYMTKTTFQKGETVNIDIVGFSRGAAMSRDFTNRVATRLKMNTYKDSGACVQIRFLGLWDTVAQFGLNGADNGSWQLVIPAEVKHVFQTVALNEHRYLFPGEAIGNGTQKGFIGSHADIGGSYGTGDLSDVALNWIVEQAKASGVKMKTWAQAGNDEWGIVTNPVLHDKSNGASDRDFCLRANNEVWADNCQKQKVATPGGMTWSQTASYINLYAQSVMNADGSSKIVGEVNMKEYAAWLKQNYGLDIQYSTP